ncbi:hypothetical protein [Amycolatopsis speibonae]|uniref:Histidine kinase n=1 Tax=Amycolatopsis speibonae TaxID=1450224 RepID=A0ABV7P4J0_9PSEU
MARDSESLPTVVQIARTVVPAIAAAALGVTAHVLGGGVIPHLGMALAIVGPVGWAGTVAVGRFRGPIAAIGAVAVAQAILHDVLLLPTHLTHHRIAPVPDGVDPWFALGMNALAIVLLGLLLTHADSALRTLHGFVRQALGRVPATADRVHSPLRSPLFRWDGTNSATEVLLRRARPRRGPPLFH